MWSVFFSSWLLTSSRAAAPKLQKRAQYKQRLWHLSPLYCKKEVRFLGHVTHVTEEITRFEASSQLAFDLLSTACDTLRSGFRPGLQLARIMECGPNWRYQCSSRHFFSVICISAWFDIIPTFFLYFFWEVARAPFTYQCWNLPHGLAQCTTSGWEKCSIARHHQAYLMVCVKCRYCANSLFWERGVYKERERELERPCARLYIYLL